MERDGWSNCERVAIDDLAAVECLRSLAGLVRTGLPLRAALLAWPAEASRDARQALVQVARRLSLGEGVGPALATLDSVWDPRASSALRTVLIVHLRVGGDVALMIDAVAEGLARRAESLEAARAAERMHASDLAIELFDYALSSMTPEERASEEGVLASVSAAKLCSVTGRAAMGRTHAQSALAAAWTANPYCRAGMRFAFPIRTDTMPSAMIEKSRTLGSPEAGRSLKPTSTR